MRWNGEKEGGKRGREGGRGREEGRNKGGRERMNLKYAEKE